MVVVGVRTRHQNEPRPIPPDDLVIIKEYLGPRRPNMTVLELRDRALFYYLFVTTARVREVLQATRRDYLRARVRQKGGGMHDLRTVPTLVMMIEEYLAARTDDLPCLWAAHGNNVHAIRPLRAPGVREIWKRLCIELGIEQFTTHQLRHTGMTELGEAEVAESVIADRAGHADLRTIHRYMKVREGQRLKADAAMEQMIRIDRPRLLPKIGRRGYGSR